MVLRLSTQSCQVSVASLRMAAALSCRALPMAHRQGQRCQVVALSQECLTHLETGGHMLGWLSFPLLVGSEAGRVS